MKGTDCLNSGLLGPALRGGVVRAGREILLVKTLNLQRVAAGRVAGVVVVVVVWWAVADFGEFRLCCTVEFGCLGDDLILRHVPR